MPPVTLLASLGACARLGEDRRPLQRVLGLAGTTTFIGESRSCLAWVLAKGQLKREQGEGPLGVSMRCSLALDLARPTVGFKSIGLRALLGALVSCCFICGCSLVLASPGTTLVGAWPAGANTKTKITTVGGVKGDFYVCSCGFWGVPGPPAGPAGPPDMLVPQKAPTGLGQSEDLRKVMQ